MVNQCYENFISSWYSMAINRYDWLGVEEWQFETKLERH